MTEQTQVVFRKWPDGDILALFPNIDGGQGQCSSYMRIGQHSGASYSRCIAVTKPATPEEYKSLASELTSIGYNLKIQQRRSNAS